MAARISTPSRPSRKTMIAELVTTVALLAESPSVAAASASLVSSASRVSRIVAPRARGWRSAWRGRPGRAAPNQIRPSMSSARPGSKRAQAALGAELEERVGLQARLLGLAVLAGAGGGLHAVQREPDQVVVGLVGLLGPRLRHRGRERGRRPGRRPVSTCSWVGDALLAACSRPRRAGRARSSAAAPRSVRARSRLASWSRRSPNAPTAPVRKATASVISKSRVTSVALDAAAVLDRDEREELQQLLRAPRGLLGREGRGGEALERLLGGVERGAEVRAGLGQRGERGRRLLLGGRAAVLGVARREDREVARGLGGGLGAARREVLLDAAAGVGEQLAQPRLVGVEQVLLDRLRSRPSAVSLPRASWSSASVPLRARAREARRGAVLAQQQPALGGRGVAARGRPR